LHLFFDAQKVSGFVIFGMTPMTKYAWDIYWIAVDPELQGKGIGKSLMAQVEREAVGQAGQAILRIETSGKSTYTRQRSFYKSCGFEEKGRIEDFYQLGDDLVIYAKKISRA
jgi:ribosomal protein S18 acetylase RimI-like enzyme